MSQHLNERDGDFERLLSEALNARTAGEFGRPDSSLADLRRALRRESSPRRHRVSSALGVLATAAAVLLIVLGVSWLGRSYHSTTTPTAPSRPSAPLQKTGFGYSPADYFPAVRSDGQPVIVRVSDGRQMRILPRGRVNATKWAPISPMILSPDGNKVYGVGRQLQDDGKPYPAGYGVEHVVAIDLRTNQFTSLATRDGRINGLTLSADGTTFAYALEGGQDGRPDRSVIYVHDLVHDTDRHFLLAAGQHVYILALSPDGSELAINAPVTAPAVRIMSTTSGLIQPPQQVLGAASCAMATFGPVQWTPSGLYAVRYCGSAGAQQTGTVVRLSSDPHQAPTVLATAPSNAIVALLIRDSAAGLGIYVQQMTTSHYGVTKLSTTGRAPVSLADIRLSGPGT